MKKIIYAICLMTMFMFIGDVKADSAKCLYKIPKNVVFDKEIDLELSNSDKDDPKLLNELNYTAGHYFEFGEKPPTWTSWFPKWKFYLTKDNKCPDITLDVPTGASKTVRIYPNEKECRNVNQINKDTCLKTVYKGTYSNDDTTAGNSTGRVNAKLITGDDTTCKYRSNYYEINIDKNRSLDCKGTNQAFNSNCNVTISNPLFDKFKTTGSFKCPEFIYYEVTGVSGNSVQTYKLKVVETGGVSDQDNSNHEQFEDPENPTGIMGDDEWLNDPTPESEIDKVDSCEIIDKNGSFYKIIKQIIGYVQIGTIFIIILLSGLDFVGAITSGDDDAFKKAVNKTKNRLIALVLVFLVPAIINLLLSIVNVGSCGSESSSIDELFE